MTTQIADEKNWKSAEIRSRIEPDLKQKSTEVLAGLGLDMSGAIRLFLRQVVEVRGLPFEVRLPNSETAAAMAEARMMKTARFSSSGELMNELEKQGRPTKTRRPAKKV